MINIVFRAIFVYFFTVFTMRLLGKRQVGQMQMSELVTAFFLSELATAVVTDRSSPLLHGLVPILVIVLVEVGVSYLTVKSHFFKHLFDFSPTVLIRDGVIQKKNLRQNRLTLDELLSLLRLSGYWNLSDVRFAFLEPNGQVSVVPYAEKDAVSREDLNLSPRDNGYTVIVVDDGKKNKRALSAINRTEAWLDREIKKQKGKSEKDFFLLVSDLSGKVWGQKNDKSEN